MPDPIRILSAADVRQSISMAEAIAAMRTAFRQLSGGAAIVPVRINMGMPSLAAQALVMPVALPGERRYGVKIVSINADNPARSLPYIHASLMLFDAASGQPAALMDAEFLTALRTGAAAGLATDLLAGSAAQTAVIFGAGAQARTELTGICAVRNFRRVYVISRSAESARRFAAEMQEAVPAEIIATEDQAVLREAEVICTATTATAPLFADDALGEGVHINAVGAYRRDMSEIPPQTVARAVLVVDQRAACLAEAGDITAPIDAGMITAAHIRGELGELVAGTIAGRKSASEVTLFKSVGNAVQDLAVAMRVLAYAERNGLGTVVPL